MVETQDFASLQSVKTGRYIKPYEFVGMVTDYREKMIYINARNRIRVGDPLEFLDPKRPVLDMVTITVPQIINQKDGATLPAAHNQYQVMIPGDESVSAGSIVRKKGAE